MTGPTHAAFALLCYYVIAYLAVLPINVPMVLTLLNFGDFLAYFQQISDLNDTRLLKTAGLPHVKALGRNLTG